MALDGIYIHSIVEELNNTILNGRVSKVTQPEKDEIMLLIKGTNNFNYKLLISASSVYPKIHLTDNSKSNPLKAPVFCMVLRKYLSSAKIIGIEQLTNDRVVKMNFEHVDELGFNSVYTLIIEIMGRHSNITLIRQRDDVIMDSIKHITPDINRVRSVYPGIKFVMPPISTKLNPFDFNNNNLEAYLNNNQIEFNEKFFSNVLTGISAQYSKELFYEINIKTLNINDIYEFITKKVLEIKSGKYNFKSYSKDSTLKDFYCINLSMFKDYTTKVYDSPSKLVEEFYFEKDKNDRLKGKSTDLLKIINTNLDRATKKREILKTNLKACSEKDIFRLYGELLTSNIYNIKKGDKKILVPNYYSETGEMVEIKIDEFKTPSQNVQLYYKKYNKLKRTEEMDTIQLKSTEEEIEYLQSVLTNIQNSDTYNDIDEIKNELIETGYIKYHNKNQKKKQSNNKPMHFTSSDGYDIYVGKNNVQNDYLTLKFAIKQDVWLHTKNMPGSHVIIKRIQGEEIPETTLLEAANLAALYSKGKTSSNVPVDYTEVKNVKKPSGAKPGMVIYYTNKTIYVTPSLKNN